jgi:hypothetical protein
MSINISNEQVVAFLKKNPFGVVCGVLSLLLAAGIYFRSDELPAQHGVLEKKTAEGELYAVNLRYADQLKKQLEDVQAADKAIEARLVRAAQLATNTQYFYRLEADTGVKLNNLTQITTTGQTQLPKTGKAPASDFVPIAFAVTAQGSYAQLVDLLHRLENGAHYCRVLNASFIKVGTESTDLLTLSLNLELLGQR